MVVTTSQRGACGLQRGRYSIASRRHQWSTFWNMILYYTRLCLVAKCTNRMHLCCAGDVPAGIP